MTHSINNYNIILDTDSYKSSHWLQYPPNTQRIFSYVESRGGKFDSTVFFGLQYYIKEYLSRQITQDNIDEAAEIWATHGEPFNKEGWEYILKEHNGFLPVEIYAVPEGTVIPNSNLLATIINTDNKCFWLPSHLETGLLRSIWYGTTVATQSYHIKKLISKYFDDTASEESKSSIDFRLHDFGARGVSSYESSGIGGMAHLLNFKGTDTIQAIRQARKYYNENMAGFSVPASEHSSITSWGKEHEEDAYKNMLKQFQDYNVISIVSDSYDLFNAVKNIYGKSLKSMIEESKGTLVIRPDSGTPHEIVLKTVEALGARFGYTTNEKGYNVLNPKVRVLQGDGIDYNSIDLILTNLKLNGWSAENVFFGMGGALLQGVNRDTQKFACKCSAALIDNKWVDVFKDPITDKGKQSKKGVLTLYKDKMLGNYSTNRIAHGAETKYDVVPQLAFNDGISYCDDSLSNIRERCKV